LGNPPSCLDALETVQRLPLASQGVLVNRYRHTPGSPLCSVPLGSQFFVGQKFNVREDGLFSGRNVFLSGPQRAPRHFQNTTLNFPARSDGSVRSCICWEAQRDHPDRQLLGRDARCLRKHGSASALHRGHAGPSSGLQRRSRHLSAGQSGTLRPITFHCRPPCSRARIVGNVRQQAVLRRKSVY